MITNPFDAPEGSIGRTILDNIYSVKIPTRHISEGYVVLWYNPETNAPVYRVYKEGETITLTHDLLKGTE